MWTFEDSSSGQVPSGHVLEGLILQAKAVAEHYADVMTSDDEPITSGFLRGGGPVPLPVSTRLRSSTTASDK